MVGRLRSCHVSLSLSLSLSLCVCFYPLVSLLFLSFCLSLSVSVCLSVHEITRVQLTVLQSAHAARLFFFFFAKLEVDPVVSLFT